MDRTVAFYPSPAGATESLLPLDAWERVLAANPALADVEPDVEALLVDAADAGFACTWCRSTPATSWSAWSGCTGRASTAARRRGRAIDAFFAALRDRTQRVTQRMPVAELAFDCIGRAADPYAAVPTLVFRLRITETSGPAVHAIALRCQIRIEPQPPRYADGEAELLGDLFGDPDRWGDTLKPLQFADGLRHGARLHRSDRDRPAGAVLATTWRSRRASTSPRWTTARSRCSCCSAARSSPGRATASRRARCRGTSEARYRCRWRCGGRLMDRYFPGSGWLRLRRDTLARLQRFKSDKRSRDLGRRIVELLARGGRPSR